MSDTAADVLRKYQKQLDPEGVEVGVSRQALDEVLEQLKQYKEVVEAFNDAIITFEIILPQINESDKPSVRGNIAYYKETINKLNKE